MTTQIAPPPHFNIPQKIWREIKRPFRSRIKAFEKVTQAKFLINQVDEGGFGGELGAVRSFMDTLLKYYRWRTVFGHSILRLLRIHKPDYNDLGYALIGIDLEKELQSTDETLIFDGIKLPQPRNHADKIIFRLEWMDIIIPSYIKRKYENYDCFGTIIGGFWDTLEGPYEYGNVCLEEGDVVFDCGANMGMFSAMASRYGCQVFAFEAVPDIIDDYLSKSATMNGNIHVCNYAVWDREEALEFSLTFDNIGRSRCNQLLGESQLRKNRKQLIVPAIPLDSFVERNGIDRVDFIKADIEGAERNMLRGATRILRDFAPKLSICTYHRPDDPQVLREIILKANPNYQIVEKFQKMYAYVPNH